MASCRSGDLSVAILSLLLQVDIHMGTALREVAERACAAGLPADSVAALERAWAARVDEAVHNCLGAAVHPRPEQAYAQRGRSRTRQRVLQLAGGDSPPDSPASCPGLGA